MQVHVQANQQTQAIVCICACMCIYHNTSPWQGCWANSRYMSMLSVGCLHDTACTPSGASQSKRGLLQLAAPPQAWLAPPTQAMIPFAWTLAQELLADADPVENTVKQCACQLWDIYQSLSEESILHADSLSTLNHYHVYVKNKFLSRTIRFS